MKFNFCFELFIVIIFINGSIGKTNISDLRKCADEKCKELISEGRTTQRYLSQEYGILSFFNDEFVQIFSKEAGNNLSLWGVKIKGKTGYVPKQFVKESRELIKFDQLKYELPTQTYGHYHKENISPSNKVTKPDILDEAPVGEIVAHSDDSEYSSLDKKSDDQTKNIVNEKFQHLKEPAGIDDSNHGSTFSPEVDNSPPSEIDNEESRGANVITADIIQDPSVIDEREPPNVKTESVFIESLSNNVIVDSVEKEFNDYSIPETDKVMQISDTTDTNSIDKENDNEDESNGNEGEENGSEVLLENAALSKSDDSVEYKSALPTVVGVITADKPLVKESIEDGESINLEASVTEPIEHTSTRIPSKSTIVVEGTTIMIDDHTGTTSHDSGGHEYQQGLYASTSPISLQTSQHINEISTSNVATPIVSEVPVSSIGPESTTIPVLEEHVSLPPLIGKARFHIKSEYRANTDTTQNKKQIDKEDSTIKSEVESKNNGFSTLRQDSVLDEPFNENENSLNSDFGNFEEKNQENDNIVLKSNEETAKSTDSDKRVPDSTDSLQYAEKKMEEPTFLSSLFEWGESSDDEFLPDNEITEHTTDRPDVEYAKKENDLEFVQYHPQNDPVIEQQNNSTPEQEPPKSMEQQVDPVIEGDQKNISLSELGQQNPPELHNNSTILQNQSGDTASTSGSGKAISPSMPEKLPDLSNESPKLDPVIANLSFIDPSEVDKEEYREPLSSEKETTSLEDSIVSTQNMEEEINSGDDEATKDSLLSSFSERILNVSMPVWHGLMIHLSQLSEGLAFAVEGELAEPQMSTGSVVFLMIVSGTILTLYFIHLIVMKHSRESPLLYAMNQLDRKQRIAMAENNTLKKELSCSNGQVTMEGYPSNVEEMKKLQSMKIIYDEETYLLKAKAQQLEADLEASVANAGELHKMNSDLLSSQTETFIFEESVNNLQSMLNSQREVVESLTSDLAHKTRLSDELRNESKSMKTKSTKLENQVEQLMNSLEEVNVGKQDYLKLLKVEETTAGSLREMNDSLHRESDVIRKERDSERHNVARTKQKLHLKEAECQVAKECLKKLQLFSDDESSNNVQGKLVDLFPFVEMKSKLLACETERDLLNDQLCKLEKSKDNYEENERKNAVELTEVKESLFLVQADREQLKSKLSVLCQYHEEKEAKLKHALESQEGLRLDAEGSAATISNRIQSYEYEISSQREKMESLKTEFEEQRKSFKMQLTNEEKKAHENWIASRAAERRQEELRQENTQLRQQINQDRSFAVKREANGSIPSPLPPDPESDGILNPMMMRPPMHHMFNPHNMPPPGMGPPPPWLLPPMIPPPGPHPDRRMPPAGRIASPPGFDRRSYSPASDDSHYSSHHHRRYSPHYSPDRSRSSARRDGQSSPDHWFMGSPEGGYSNRHRSPPRGYFDETDNYESRRAAPRHLETKTSTPLGSNDR